MADLQNALDVLDLGTYKPGSGQVVWWEYYDRAVIANATREHSYFQTPINQGGKNKADTNFPLAGLMPSTEKMAVMYLMYSYIPHAAMSHATYQLWLNMIAQTTIEANIRGIKDVMEYTLVSAFSPAMPAVLLGAGVGDQALGQTQFNAIYELEIEIVLAANTNFTFDLIHHTPANAALDADKLFLSMIGPKAYLS